MFTVQITSNLVQSFIECLLCAWSFLFVSKKAVFISGKCVSSLSLPISNTCRVIWFYMRKEGKVFLSRAVSRKLHHVLWGRRLNPTHRTPELTTLLRRKSLQLPSSGSCSFRDCYYKSKVYSHKNDINRNNNNHNAHQILSTTALTAHIHRSRLGGKT